MQKLLEMPANRICIDHACFKSLRESCHDLVAGMVAVQAKDIDKLAYSFGRIEASFQTCEEGLINWWPIHPPLANGVCVLKRTGTLFEQG
jgi:hypothetical protein